MASQLLKPYGVLATIIRRVSGRVRPWAPHGGIVVLGAFGAGAWWPQSPSGAVAIAAAASLATVISLCRERLHVLELELRSRRLESAARETDIEAQAARVLEQQRQLTEQNVLLEEKNRELGRANQLKGQFLASMSHELRTPLNAIIGFSDLMLEGLHGPLTAAQQDPLHDIRSAGRHLLTLINDILDLSKIEAGRMTLRAEPVELAVTVREALEMVEPLAHQKGVVCEANLDEQVRVLGDPLRLRQVVLNLLANAVKFTPRGGSVKLQLAVNHDVATLEVQDTGIGIAKENHQRIFEAFQQVDDGSHKATEGTGLGLALVARLLEPMDGQISVQSELGEGATFRVDLPRLKLVDEPRVVRSFPGAVAPDVIVAEGDDATRMLLGRVLQANGFSVRMQPNGQRTVEALAEKLPNVLVLDLMMPELDGYSVLERLVGLPGHETVQVLVFTGYQPDETLSLVRHPTRVVVKGSLSTPELVALISKMASEQKRSAA